MDDKATAQVTIRLKQRTEVQTFTQVQVHCQAHTYTIRVCKDNKNVVHDTTHVGCKINK